MFIFRFVMYFAGGTARSHNSPSPPPSPALPPPLFPPFVDEAHFRISENAGQMPKVKWENGFKIFIPNEDLEKWKEMIEIGFAKYVFF